LLRGLRGRCGVRDQAMADSDGGARRHPGTSLMLRMKPASK
jgi:hypothetical protein